MQEIRFLFLYAGNKTSHQLPFSSIFYIEEAKDGKDNSSNKVYEQIFHSIQKADVQIAAKAQRLTVYDYLTYIVNCRGVVAPGRVQHDGIDRMYDRVFLHVHTEEHIHAALEKFPDHPDGHGKTEGHNSHEYRGKLEGEALVPVQNIHHRKPDSCGQKAVQRMKQGIPKRVFDIIGPDLSENLR